MKSAYDIIIVGGGVIGSSIAWFLSDLAPDTSVLVVEKDPSYQFGSTGRSVAGIRQQYSTPENIAMSQFGITFLQNLKETFGAEADVSFRPNPYLFLATEEGRQTLMANHEVQKAQGADIALLKPDELKARLPWLEVDDIALGAIGESGEGWLDAYSLMQLFRKTARQNGADYGDEAATGLLMTDGAVSGVTLASGEHVSCGVLVNAAGVEAAKVASWAGLTLPVEPRKRYVYVIDCREEITNSPLTIDPSGVYFRPESGQFLCGRSPEPGDEPEVGDFEVDYDYFETSVWPILANRVRAFEAVKLANAWVGYYAYNTSDQNAILGPHPEVRNFYFANGFSGHGLQQSPAVGRAISEHIVHGGFTSVDLSRFSYERIARDEPIVELNVV
ncbi:MAG: NAD(P)/FAD-dependent oxidoreductase [Hyphomicrobiales bacterium]